MRANAFARLLLQPPSSEPLGDWPRMTPAERSAYVADLKRRTRDREEFLYLRR